MSGVEDLVSDTAEDKPLFVLLRKPVFLVEKLLGPRPLWLISASLVNVLFKLQIVV